MAVAVEDKDEGLRGKMRWRRTGMGKMRQLRWRDKNGDQAKRRR